MKHLILILLLAGCETVSSAPEYKEPTGGFALEKGCKSIDSCSLTNNRNEYDSTKIKPVDCTLPRACASDMRRVCSTRYGIDLCVDTNLISVGGVPEGNYSYPKCQAKCASLGKRVLNNNEWLVAVNGTDHLKCKAPSPKNRKLGSATQDAPDYNSSSDMKNLKFNAKGIRQDRGECVSIYGVKDGVSVLGQWVSDGYRSNKPQFNGGLWAFPSASTIYYRTSAHGPSYYDYSIGCRCGK